MIFVVFLGHRRRTEVDLVESENQNEECLDLHHHEIAVHESHRQRTDLEKGKLALRNRCLHVEIRFVLDPVLIRVRLF